jgi:hypothetical protein
VLIGTILDELERQDKATGLVTMCAAGGMAPAIIIERVYASIAKPGRPLAGSPLENPSLRAGVFFGAVVDSKRS